MKLLIKFILLITTMTSLVANGEENPGSPLTIAVKIQIATKSVQSRVNILKIYKPKVFVGKPYKLFIVVDKDDMEFLEIDDVITGYRRRDLQQIHTDSSLDNPEELSEYIRWRLFLARTAAMLKYHQVHNAV